MEWTKSGVSVEREGKMKTTEIKENEDSAARKKKRKEKSPSAVHEGKSGVKKNEKGNGKRLKNEWKGNM